MFGFLLFELKMDQAGQNDLAGCAGPITSLSGEHQSSIRTFHRQLLCAKGQTELTLPLAIIHAAWALVMSRVVNSKDVVFDVAMVGDSDQGELGLLAIEAIPVRFQIPIDQTIREYLDDTKTQVSDGKEFQLGELESMLDLSLIQYQGYKFRTLLIIQSPEAGRKSPIAQDGGQHQQLAAYGLLLHAYVQADHVTLSTSFISDVVNEQVAQTLLSRLHYTIAQLDQAKPDLLLSKIEMATPEDLEQIWRWNAIVPPPAEQSVYQIIAEQVQARPEAPAICSWDGELTYGKLDELSTLLAGRLLDVGIGPNILVSLCFEKSMWTTVAILAVIKTGGGFILLDPSLPEQRLKAITQQVEGSLVLCSPSTQQLGSRLGKDMIIDWNMFTDLKAQAGRQFDSICPSSILYIVFTSGSTGTPKGAMITYQNAASALRYHLERLGLTPESRTFDLASYSVDVSISNVLTILAAGGCLCVPDEDRSNKYRAKHIISTSKYH